MLIDYLIMPYTGFSDLVRKLSIKRWNVWRPLVNAQRSLSSNLEHNTSIVVADGNGGVVVWEEEFFKL
jgi:hypothetical protein